MQLVFVLIFWVQDVNDLLASILEMAQHEIKHRARLVTDLGGELTFEPPGRSSGRPVVEKPFDLVKLREALTEVLSAESGSTRHRRSKQQV